MGFGSSQSQYWPCWDRRLRHRSPWPTTNSIENSLSPNICNCFLQLAPPLLFLANKIEKEKKKEERERKGGEKSRPKRDRTRQSISRWSNKSKDRLLTTVFKSTERKKTQRESLSDLLRYPAIMDFRYFLLDSKRKLLLLPSTSHTVEWMNLELLTVWQRVTYTASSWVKVWNESTRYPVHDWNKTWGKKMMKRILSSHDRESKEIWKIETGSGPICRFLEQRESFRYPTDSL